MVYENVVHQPMAGGYENEHFRAAHGYKDAHMHDPPQRRNRDFRPVSYGTFRGMPNYRHSEPFCLLKNMKDFANEEHNIGVRMSKSFLKGGFVGSVLGYLHFMGSTQGSFEMNKLANIIGPRKFTGGSLR